MPTFVDPSKCDGCKGGEKTACMYICPNDLMVLDPDAMRAYNQEPDACWECYSCVKICPQGAITARPYADFAPLGGTCIPMRSADSIMWTVNFRDGSTKRFKSPIPYLQALKFVFLSIDKSVTRIFRSKLLCL